MTYFQKEKREKEEKGKGKEEEEEKNSKTFLISYYGSLEVARAFTCKALNFCLFPSISYNPVKDFFPDLISFL